MADKGLIAPLEDPGTSGLLPPIGEAPEIAPEPSVGDTLRSELTALQRAQQIQDAQQHKSIPVEVDGQNFDLPLQGVIGRKSGAFLVGVGRGLSFAWRGLQQIANDIPAVDNAFSSLGIDLSSDEELAEDSRLYEELVNDPDLGSFAFTGEIFGTLVEPVGLVIPGGKAVSLGKLAVRGAVIGGGFGALGEVQEGGFSRGQNALLGAASGGALLPAMFVGMKVAKAMAKTGADYKKGFFSGTAAQNGNASQPVTKGSAGVSTSIPAGKPHIRPKGGSAPPGVTKDPRSIRGVDPATKGATPEEISQSIEGLLEPKTIRKAASGVAPKGAVTPPKTDNIHFSSVEELNRYQQWFEGFLDDQFGGFVGKMDVGEVVLAASRVGLDHKVTAKLLEDYVKGGGVPNPAKFLAGIMVQQDLSAKAKAAALAIKKAIKNGEDIPTEEALKFRIAAEQQEGHRLFLRGALSDWGRIGRMSQLAAKLDADPGSTQRMKEILEELGGGSAQEVFAGNAGKLGEILDLMDEATDLLTMSKLLRAGTKPTYKEKGIFFMLNNMLMNVQTHVINFLSNAGMQVLGNADKLTEAILSLPSKNPNRVSLTEYAAFTTGQFEGAIRGTKLAWKIFRGLEEPATRKTKLELLRRVEIKAHLAEDFSQVMPMTAARGLVGLYDTFGRSLVAGDELFASMTRLGEARALAVREAYKKIGLSTKKGKKPMFAPGSVKFWKYVDSLEQDILAGKGVTGRRLRAQAEDLADQLKFTEDPGKFVSDVMKHANSHILTKALLPFIRTPVNIVKQAFRHSPLQLFRSKVYRDAAAGDMRALAQTIVGAGLWTTGYMMANSGYITGTGPANPNLMQEREMAGIPPNSFHIKRFLKDFGGLDEETMDKWAKEVGLSEGMPGWVAYNRFDPLGIMFGITADANEMFNVAFGGSTAVDPQTDRNLVAFGMSIITRNLIDKFYLSAVNDLFSVFNSTGDTYGALERFTKSYLNSLVMAAPGAAVGVAGKVGAAVGLALVPVGTGVNPLTANVARTVDSRKVLRRGDRSLGLFTLEENRFYDSVLKEFAAKFPMWRDNVLPERNPLGEVVYYGGRPAKTPVEKAVHFLNPAYINDTPVTALKADIFNLGLDIQKPSYKIGNVTLNDEQYDFYLKRQGEIFKNTFGPIVGGDQPVGNVRIDPSTRKILFDNMTSAQLKEKYTGLDAAMRKRLIRDFLSSARQMARLETELKFGLQLPEVQDKLNELFKPALD